MVGNRFFFVWDGPNWHKHVFILCMISIRHQYYCAHVDLSGWNILLWNRVKRVSLQACKIIIPLEQWSYREPDQTKPQSNTTNHIPFIGKKHKSILEIFSDADPEFFEECLSKFREDECKKEETKSKREAIWKRLEEVAKKKFVQPISPCSFPIR